MSRVIAVSNQKGGVGKTTTTINLASGLASLGKTVLVVDMDPQGNATSGLGVDKGNSENSIYQVLIGEASLPQVIKSTSQPRLFVAPSNRHLVGAEVDLLQLPQREYRLQQALKSGAAAMDYVLIDCPPSLSLLTLNALTAADSVLIPLQCEYFAMEGLGELVNTLKLVKQSLNPALDREGILLTMYDGRNRLARHVAQEVRQLFGTLVFDTNIPRTVRLSEAPSFGMSIQQYDVRSPGAEAYTALAGELINRHKKAARSRA